ncbi:MAG TPA: hypothetical protein PLQ86_10780, partial [Candidatus Aminicenantes bacterium]|nr:hypothetical protein [Candidatus Aminicenantes bacterium]
MNTRLRIIFAMVALTAVFFPASLFALTPLELATTAKPPVIDAKLDPGEWDGAYAMTEFKTIQPDYGKEPSQKTEAYFLY